MMCEIIYDFIRGNAHAKAQERVYVCRKAAAAVLPLFIPA